MSKQFCVMLLLLWACSGVIGKEPSDDSVVAKAEAMDAIVQGVKEIEEILKKKNVVLNTDTLKPTVLDAMITAIDPHAAILTKEQVDKLQVEQQGTFYGVGLKIKIQDKQTQILEVIKGGPAGNSELKAGDVIEKIGEQSTESMTLEDMVNYLRGKENEVVELWIRGKGEIPEPRLVNIKRGLVHIPVTGTIEEWPNQIGYIKVNGLYEGSGDQIVTQLKTWADTNYFGVILDIRGTDGIDLESVARIAGQFSKDGAPLFSVRDGHNTVITEYRAKNGKRLTMPVMLLVDLETRGSAETLAAVLQNCHGAMLIGNPTSGDGRIREAIPLTDGKMLYIATRYIHLNKGMSYSNKGVIPDIIVSQFDANPPIEQADWKEDFGLFSGLTEHEKQERGLITRVSSDAILRRAVDILLGIKALDIQVH